MNVLFTTYQGDVAGSTNSIYYLATSLAQRGHQIYMACRPESLINQMFHDTNVETIAVDFRNKFDLKAAQRIKQIVRSKQIDLINSQSGRDRYTVIWSRLFYGSKSAHVNTRRQRPLSGGGRLVNRFIASNTEKVVAVSNSIKSELVKIGYPDGHVSVIYNGTPIEKYEAINRDKVSALRKKLRIEDDTPVLGSVSRPKNHDQLLKALKLMDRKVTLLLVGIDESPAYRMIIDEYATPHAVHFIGTVPNQEALDYMQLFDMMILPSTIEGISQSILEAMASGVPVIATNSSGNPEIIHDKINGLLFDDGDIPSLSEKISFFLDNPEEKKKIIEAGKDTALNRFSLKRTVDQYEALFLDLISSNTEV